MMMEPVVQQMKWLFHVFGILDFFFGIAFVTYTFLAFSCVSGWDKVVSVPTYIYLLYCVL